MTKPKRSYSSVSTRISAEADELLTKMSQRSKWNKPALHEHLIFEGYKIGLDNPKVINSLNEMKQAIQDRLEKKAYLKKQVQKFKAMDNPPICGRFGLGTGGFYCIGDMNGRFIKTLIDVDFDIALDFCDRHIVSVTEKRLIAYAKMSKKERIKEDAKIKIADQYLDQDELEYNTKMRAMGFPHMCKTRTLREYRKLVERQDQERKQAESDESMKTLKDTLENKRRLKGFDFR